MAEQAFLTVFPGFFNILLDESDAISGAAGWGLGKLADKFLVADKERYAKVRKFGPSKDFFVGDEYLKQAKNAVDKTRYYSVAEEKMLGSITETSAETQKARAYRRAAIAAKLKGESAVAKEYLRKSRSARWAAEGSASSEPARDLEKLNKNDFFVNKATAPVKIVAGIPFLLAEAIGRAVTDAVFKTNLSEKELLTEKALKTTMPFQCALDNASFQLKKDYEEIAYAGECSDEEWIDDNDPKARGVSTGKGLRHQYL